MEPYPVATDQHVDASPPMDSWAAFLNARFSERPQMWKRFKNAEKDMVRKELRRIRYLREYFAKHRIHPRDLGLEASLETAHGEWKTQAKQAAAPELAKCETELSRNLDPRDRGFAERRRHILRQVQKWQTGQYKEYQRPMFPESYIDDLNATDDTVDDDPRQPDYGYNGWVIVFEKGKGGVTPKYPHCQGKFPHQKIAMQKLLYDKANTPLKRTKDWTQLRYFHLQANNMKWVEVSKVDLRRYGKLVANQWLRRLYPDIMRKKRLWIPSATSDI